MNGEPHLEHDESRPGSDQNASARNFGNGPTRIDTTDPVVDREAQTQTRWQRQPTSTITTDVAEPTGTGPVFLNSPRPVVVETDPDGLDEDHDQDTGSQRTGPRQASRASGNREREDVDKTHGAGWGSLIGALVVGLILGLGSAWAYEHSFGAETKDHEKSESGSSSKSKQGQSGGENRASKNSGAADLAGFGSPDETRNLHAKTEELSERIDRLRMRLDRLKPDSRTPPPGLSTLQIQVGELSREVDNVAYLPEQVRRMQNELDDLKQRVRSQAQSAPTSLSSPSDQPSPDPGSPSVRGVGRTSGPRPDEPAVIDLNDTSSALDQGMRLLEQRRPVVALDLFRSLETKEPDDARVWYLAALATGDATEDWNGEARRLVGHGLALERADSPSSDQVDRTLEQLQERHVRGLDWLNAYRRQVVLKD